MRRQTAKHEAIKRLPGEKIEHKKTGAVAGLVIIDYPILEVMLIQTEAYQNLLSFW